MIEISKDSATTTITTPVAFTVGNSGSSIAIATANSHEHYFKQKTEAELLADAEQFIKDNFEHPSDYFAAFYRLYIQPLEDRIVELENRLARYAALLDK